LTLRYRQDILPNKVKKSHILLLILFAFSCIALHAQESFLDQIQDGKEIDFSFSMDNISAGTLMLGTGFTVENFLHIGLLWKMNFTQIVNLPAQELRIGIVARAAVLKQDQSIPFSFNLIGSFTKENFLSQYLQDNEMRKTGTGLSVGLELFRDFVLKSPAAIRLGLVGAYETDSYVTEPLSGLVDVSEREYQENVSYTYGIFGGVTFLLSDRLLLSVFLDGRLDQDFHIRYGPRIQLLSSDVPIIFNVIEDDEYTQ
jgi:hypothetical protein